MVSPEGGPKVAINGRTRRGPDGLYETLDLTQVGPGDRVVLLNTKGGVHVLEKGDNTSTLAGWRQAEKVGDTALRLTLLDTGGFRTWGVVLAPGSRVLIADEDLGKVDSIEYTTAAELASTNMS